MTTRNAAAALFALAGIAAALELVAAALGWEIGRAAVLAIAFTAAASAAGVALNR